MPNNQICECTTVPLSSTLDKLGGEIIGADSHQIRRIVAAAGPLGYLELCHWRVPRGVTARQSGGQSVMGFNSGGKPC